MPNWFEGVTGLEVLTGVVVGLFELAKGSVFKPFPGAFAPPIGLNELFAANEPPAEPGFPPSFAPGLSGGVEAKAALSLSPGFTVLFWSGGFFFPPPKRLLARSMSEGDFPSMEPGSACPSVCAPFSKLACLFSPPPVI